MAKSEAINRTAATLIPGPAVTSAEESCSNVGSLPVFARGKGAMLTDVDGNEYIDYACANGAMILGHADERIAVAINKATLKGGHLGSPSATEVRLAELIASRFASIDMVRFVLSERDAVVRAISLARRCTGRATLVTFAGCGPGWAGEVSTEDANYIGGPAGSILVAPYNDADAAERLFDSQGTAVAAVFVEPVAHSFGLVPPGEGFLAALRKLCNEHGALLIFDETKTGFRVASGGAAALYDLVPDLTVLGPIIGGGLPLAAYGGRKEIMKRAASIPELNRAGVASGHQLAMAAGVATLQAIGDSDFHDRLEAKAARLDEGLRAASAAAGIAACHTRVGSMVGLFFARYTVKDLDSARTDDRGMYSRFFLAMLDQGMYLPPFRSTPWFISAAHTDQQIDRTIEAAGDVYRHISGSE